MLNFQDLYESYAPDVYRFALWFAGDSREAEDVTAETFVRAWAHNSAIRTETLKAYLFTIARNVYLERQRKSRQQVALEDGYPDPAPGPDQVVAQRLELQRVRGVLRTCPEIARVLGLSLTATKVKVHRVRKRWKPIKRPSA
jgi:RNA polymerase sigma-70 factor (ECF subfamily)